MFIWKNIQFKTKRGIVVELDSIDMSDIHKYYEIQCTADYLRYIHEDWAENKIQDIAYEVRDQMNNFGYCESEAIDIVIREYENSHNK